MTTETNGKTTPTTALEIRSPIPSTIAYEPRNFDEAMRLAVTYAKSNLLGEVRSPEAALLVMACGADLGISPTAALRGIYIVKGRPFLSADLMVALCLRRTDLCEFFSCTEVNATSATYETKRKGAPVAKSTFTIDDARRAGLLKDDSAWLKYPQDMMRHRAAARLARMVYPDIVMGFNVPEEADEIAESAARGPMVLDADFEPVPAPKASAVERPVVEEKQPARMKPEAPVERQASAPPVSFGDMPPANDPPPKNEEPLVDCVMRWGAALAKAETVADADRVRREVKKRVPETDPVFQQMVAEYKATVMRLRKPGSTKPEDVIT